MDGLLHFYHYADMKNMTAIEIAKEMTVNAKALFKGECYGATITNEIFLIIQNNKNLMQEYLKAVELFKLDAINQNIGKAVKEWYSLENDGDNREEHLTSTLIRSHQIFK